MEDMNKKLVKKLLKQNKHIISLLKEIKKKQVKDLKKTEQRLEETSIQERARKRIRSRDITENDEFED